MPLYGYLCDVHGEFRDWRRMSEYTLDARCPTCGAPSPRLPGMPFLPCLSQNSRIAHERNERSAHEPKVVRREPSQPVAGHRHGRQARHGHASHRPNMLGHAH